MFQRTGSDNFPTHLKMMVSGPPKAGKTTLLGTVPNIVIADTEPHANNLQSVAHLNLPYVTINGLSDLQGLRMVLNDPALRQQAAQSLGMDKIEAVAIDTLDTLQGLMKKERLRETRQAQFLRDDWAWLKEEMTKIIESFTALPLHVFFIVHTKTQEVGKGDDSRTVVLPGLEGAIAQSIAGMVGYSLLAFRKEEIRPDGSKYTKYWLRAEGDETYEFLGNRAAGRLPDVIEPDFKAIYDAVQAGRPTQQSAPVPTPTIQVTQDPAQAQPQTPVQTPAAPAPAQAAPAAAPAPEAQAPAPAPAAAPAEGDRPPGDEPVNPAALMHMKKVYDALEVVFPEDTLKSLTMQDARTLVKMWQACQQDDAEGKTPEGQTARGVMLDYLSSSGWLSSEEKAAPAPAVEPKVDGTIEQVMAYVGDDLAKVQEAYDLESAKDKPRASLITGLEKKGAKVQTPVETPAPEEPVTPAPATVDDTPTEDEAVQTVQEVLGAKEIATEVNPDAKCEECQGPLDDPDIARLGRARFDRVLCVNDYLAETKKPR